MLIALSFATFLLVCKVLDFFVLVDPLEVLFNPIWVDQTLFELLASVVH